MGEEKKVLTRLPLELHKKIAELAGGDLRSINAEIVILLLEAVENREKRATAKKDSRLPIMNSEQAA